MTLVAAFEIGRRIAAGLPPEKVSIASPESVARRYIPIMEMCKQEEFRVINLDSAHQIISEKVVTRGSLNASIVHPREVFKYAIAESAAAIIVLHNHPSGNHKPSREDRSVTAKLVSAGKIIGIEVLDHIIIAGRKYYSFASHNEIDGN